MQVIKDKTTILVIPSLFPQSEGDIKGVFILDYIKSVLPYCNIIVFDMQPHIQKNGAEIIAEKEYLYIRNYYRFSSLGRFAKIIKYIKMLYASYKYSIDLPPQIQLIHVHGSVFTGLSAFIISRRINVSYIISEHTGPFSKVSGNIIIKSISKFVIKKSCALLTVSKDLANQISTAGIKSHVTYVTYNPVDTQLFSLAIKKSVHKRFLFVGRLEEYKGAFRSILAFHAAWQECPGWQFVIIGKGPEEKGIEDFLSQNTLFSKCVVQKGMCSKAEIAEYMKISDFFIFPSLHETFGIVVAEAMACGLPVIVGDKSAPTEFVDEECGLLVDANNTLALAAAIQTMVRTCHNYDRYLIRQKIVERFGFDKFGEKLNSIYQDYLE